jgi:hypothetical protein
MNRPSEDNAAHASSRTVSWAMLLHVVCCGLPLLLFVLISAGLTVDVLWRVAPYLALVGLGGRLLVGVLAAATVLDLYDV